MLKTTIVKGVLGIVAALLATLPAHAQTCGPDTSATATTTDARATLSMGDRTLLRALAQANLAEIEMGKLAQSKSQNEQVRNFAQKMIDDHTKALKDVQALALARGLTLPAELDRMQRAKADRIGRLSGEAFDRTYMAQAGVADHKKTHDQLRSAQKRARDPELRALAERTLPVVDEHLDAAMQLHKNTATGRSGTSGTTGSSPERR